MISIYGLSDPRTDELRYVGKTQSSLEERKKEHLQVASKPKHQHRVTWIRSLLAEGVKPDIWLIEEVPEENWQREERFWIAYFKSIGCNLVNRTVGGDGISNPSVEIREKIRLAKFGKKHSPEAREKMRLVLLGNKRSLGYKHSPETKEKMRQAHLGQERSPETREKIRLANLGNKKNLGHKHSPETKEKIGLASRGKKLSEEHKNKMRMAALGNKHGLGHKHSPETIEKMRQAQQRRRENRGGQS